MKAVAQNGSALEHATEELRGDHEVVMKAVTQKGFAVQYASDEMRGDKEIMEAALATVSSHGGAPVGFKACPSDEKTQPHLLHFCIFCHALKRQGRFSSFPLSVQT